MYSNGRHHYDWPFQSEQAEKIRDYYSANLLLADCLNSECYVSREVREEIEATMLLPVAEIEKWKEEKKEERRELNKSSQPRHRLLPIVNR
jgi:hypothetical protein